MTSNDEISEFIKKKGKARPSEIEEALKFSDSKVSRILGELLEKKLVCKSGLTRSVFYELEPADNNQPTPTPKQKNPPVADKTILQEKQTDKALKVQDQEDSKKADSPKVPSILIKAKDRLEQWSNAIKSWQGFILPIMIAVGIISGPLLWVGSIISPFFAHRHERNEQQEELVQTKQDLQLERQKSVSLENELKGTREELQQAKQEMTARASNIQDELNRTKEELQQAKGEMRAGKDNASIMQNELNKTREELQEAQRQNKTGIENASSLQNELNKTREELQEAQRQNKTGIENASSLQNELNQTKAQLQQAQAQILTLHNELNKTKEQQLTQKEYQPLNPPTPNKITMDDVARLAKQGMAASEIINQIQQNHCSYHLTNEDNSWLRQQGVSTEVITFMNNTRQSQGQGQVNSQVTNTVMGWIKAKLNGQ